MIVATEFTFIPATCEGTTTSLHPIFRCNVFVETGGDGQYTYGYTCTESFFTDAERTAHQHDEHGYLACCCGGTFHDQASATHHVMTLWTEVGPSKHYML